MDRRILLCFALIAITAASGSPSPLQPYKDYDHSIELGKDTAQVWWSVNEDKQMITFELHVKTTGWIALGISPGRKCDQFSEVLLAPDGNAFQREE